VSLELKTWKVLEKIYKHKYALIAEKLDMLESGNFDTWASD